MGVGGPRSVEQTDWRWRLRDTERDVQLERTSWAPGEPPPGLYLWVHSTDSQPGLLGLPIWPSYVKQSQRQAYHALPGTGSRAAPTVPAPTRQPEPRTVRCLVRHPALGNLNSYQHCGTSESMAWPRPTARRGANQYRQPSATAARWAPPPPPPARPIPIWPFPSKPQLDPRRPCGEYWHTDCQQMVGPPNWTHTGSCDWLLRQQTAGDRASNPETLEQLSRDRVFEVRIEVAFNPSSPLPALERLSRDQRHETRWRVASNPSCPPALLQQLSHDLHSTVRLYVAGNRSCPPATLERMAFDSNPLVRREAACNQSCPEPTLIRLLGDANRDVASSALDNPALPPSIRAMWQLAHDQS